MKKFDDSYVLLADMYSDDYYPQTSVDKIKTEIIKVIDFLEQGNSDKVAIQGKFDTMTLAINDLQEEFEKSGSDIETIARESIGDAVAHILTWFEIDIDIEVAIDERTW